MAKELIDQMIIGNIPLTERHKFWEDIFFLLCVDSYSFVFVCFCVCVSVCTGSETCQL